MKGLPLVLLILTVSAVGCDENPVSPSEIVDITWKLESIARVGSALVTVPNPDQFTVRFEGSNRAAVRADCNSCTGGYNLDGSSISIGPLACTRVACPTPGLDTLYTSALENVRSVATSGDQLVMSGTEFTLRFRN
jgi:heat shock protein HslJ